nr:NS1 [Chapparvovirus sp.]
MYRGRVEGIPEVQDGVRRGVEMLLIPPYDNTFLCYNKNNLDDFVELNENDYEEYLSYYQTYNSLGIVIRALPGNAITTIDLLLPLKEEITQPFVLIAEHSDKSVWHWHMIWFHCARSDNAKRALEKILEELPISVCCQKTKSFKHLAKYILKDVRTLTVQNDKHLWNLLITMLKRETPYTPVEEKFTNEMVHDLIKIMRQHKRYTMEELVRYAPEIMSKYLHKPNIDSIIQNCKVFLLRPTDHKIIFERLFDIDVGISLFAIFAYLHYQNINAKHFLLDVGRVLMQITSKRNCFVIEGCSNTGKTTFIRPLLKIFNWGEIQSSGQFMFQNCINKELLIWEEPLIGHDFVEGVKRVFEGMDTQVAVKYKPPQTLYRTPILITTNKKLWHYSTSDEAALRNRIFLYYFNNCAAGFDEWLGEHYSECRRKYRKFIRDCCTAITGICPDCTSSPEHSPCTSTSGSDFSDSQPVHTDDSRSEKHAIRSGISNTIVFESEYIIAYDAFFLKIQILLQENIWQPAKDYLSGGTTTDEPAAAEVREQQAPSHQDLQATIAPQLTTTGAEAELQPEVPQDDEAVPHYDVMLIDDVPQEIADANLTDEEWMEIDKYLEDLEELFRVSRHISTKFIVLQEYTLPLKKYPKLKLNRSTTWIGHLIPR